MEQSEAVFIRKILNDMSDGVILIGFDGKIIVHNRAAEHLLGMPEDCLNNRSIAWIMRQTEQNDELFELILTVVSSKERVEKVLPFFRGDDMLYYRVTTDFLSDRSTDGVIVQISDVTDATNLFIANKRLANQVTNLMHSFVTIMVTEIEEKSLYNANHTKSMVSYAKRYLGWLSEQDRLADYTSENTEPFLMSVWLHDIGKLLVPQEIMDKPTRLGSARKDIQHRIEIARLMLRIETLSHPEQKTDADVQLEKLRDAEALILSADQAGFLDEETIAKLREAAALECPDSDGSLHPLLNEKELEAITIVRGTLTAEERQIIESHVSMTAKLLSKMEFRGEYKQVPLWAAGHHELLDGSGYPSHLHGDEIPWETRLLTIIDIYDALTAEDRPYKPPLPPEKAFSILRDMAEHGKLDADILNSFYESHAWQRTETA